MNLRINVGFSGFIEYLSRGNTEDAALARGTRI